MKKSQILAALALAFALGVVAPVVSTTNTVSAFTAADATAKPPVQGSATKADVLNATAAIKANPTYANMLALKEVIKEYQVTPAVDSEYGEIISGSNGTTNRFGLPDALSALMTAEGSDELKAYNDFAAELNKQYNAKDITYSQVISKLVDEAKSATYYPVLAPVFEAYGNGTTTFKKAEFIDAVLNFNAKIKASQDYPVLDINTANVKPGVVYGAVAQAFNAEMKTEYGSDTTVTFTLYKELCNAAIKAEEANTKYNAGYTAFMRALNADGILNTNGKIALAKLEAGDTTTDHKKSATLAELYAIATGTNSDYNTWMTGSASVYSKVDAAEHGAINVDSNDNYQLIIAMATAYARVTGNNTQTVQEIAATLVGYKAPAEEGGNATVTDGPVSVTGKFDASSIKVKATKSDKKVAAFGDSKYAMYDIILTDNAGNKVNVEGSVMVSIDVPEGIDGAKSSIYYVTDDGKVEKLAARYENGKLSFTVSHFSLYAIVEDNGKNFGISAPDTGILATAEGTASTTVAMVAGIATALTAAGAGVVAYRNARRSTRK